MQQPSIFTTRYCSERGKTGGGGDADVPKICETDLAIIGTYGNTPGFKGITGGSKSSSVTGK
jgi:hypothetical protein